MSLEEIRVKEEEKIKDEPPCETDSNLSINVSVKKESSWDSDLCKEESNDIVKEDVPAELYSDLQAKNELVLDPELIHSDSVENDCIDLENLSECYDKQQTKLEFAHSIKQIVFQDCIVRLDRIDASQLKKSYQDSVFARPKFSDTKDGKISRKRSKNNLNIVKNIYICDICSKELKKRVSIVKHLQTHKNKKIHIKYACKICQKTFDYSSSLLSHETTHTGEKPFKCELCGKKVTTMNNLKKHVLNHMNDRPFSCDICNRQFLRERWLINHKRCHTGEMPFKCEICGKRMKYKSSLVDHIRTHSDANTNKHTCDFCGSKFTRKSHLVIHERKHTGEKPFPCEVCKRSFSSKSVLNTHMRLHTGEKPYACNMCLMRFTTSGRLGLHKKRHIEKK